MGQFNSLEEFIISRTDNFSDFTQSINETSPLFLEGEGVIYIQHEDNAVVYKDTFYLFQLNSHLYASAIKEDLTNKKRSFDGIYHFDSSLLKSNAFKEAKQKNYNTRFKPFDAKIEVECKYYGSSTESKLLFSKSGKIDLLYSHHVTIVNDNDSIKVQAFPSLKQVIQWQKMVNEVNLRTAKLLADKKSKSDK